MSNTYASVQDLYAVMDKRTATQLSTDTNDSSQGAEPNIQTLLDMSASEIDMFLVGRFGTAPVSPVPAVVKWMVIVKTQYKLFLRRNEVPKGVEASNRRVDELLEQLVKGVINLAGLTRVAPALQDSNSLNGRSSFDGIFGVSPAPTSPGGQALGLTVPSQGSVQPLT